jgi:hypothetical protein
MRVVRKNKRFNNASDAYVAGDNYISNYGKFKGHNYRVESWSNGLNYYFYVDVINQAGNVLKTLTNWRVSC